MEKENNKLENKKKNKIVIIVAILTIIFILIIGGILFWREYIDRSYEVETITEFSYFKIYENEKYGVIDRKGNILVEPQYDVLAIPNPSKAVFIGSFNYDSQKGEYQTEVINEKNEKILTKYNGVKPLMFKDALAEVPYEKSVLTYQENGKYGILDLEGNKITNAIYDEVESLLYKEGCLLVKQNDKYGVINSKGKKMVEIEYDSIIADGYYQDETKYQKAGFIVGKKKEEGYRYGYIDANGKQLLEEEYNEIDRITEITKDNEIYLLALKNGQAGVYKNKKQIIKTSYEEIEYRKQNELFLVQKNGKQGVIDKDGNEILKVEYDYILLEEQMIHAQKEENSYSFDLQGNEKENQNDKTRLSIENQNYFITIDGQDKFGIIDKQGNDILENQYEYIEYAFGDYFIITEGGKVSVIDAKSKEKIVTGYDVIQKVDKKNVLQAILTKPYTISIYNEKMEKTASMQEANLTIEENVIKLTSKVERMYFDNNGNKTTYQEINSGLSLYAYQGENGKWGFGNKEGKIVIEAIYDMVTELNQYGYAGIKKGNLWGVINQEGTIIVEPSYEIEWEEPQFIGPYCKLNFGYGMIYYTKEISKEEN